VLRGRGKCVGVNSSADTIRTAVSRSGGGREGNTRRLHKG